MPNLNLKGIDWVIVGGESSRPTRPLRAEWVEDIRRQCEEAGVAFFFKQWGGTNKNRQDVCSTAARITKCRTAMLDLFTPWQLRRRNHSKKWTRDRYNWQPEADQLTQQNLELAFNLSLFFRPNPSHDPSRLYCLKAGSVLFIQAVNLQTQKALVYSPSLPDAPWIKEA